LTALQRGGHVDHKIVSKHAYEYSYDVASRKTKVEKGGRRDKSVACDNVNWNIIEEYYFLGYNAV
jgi:hypothetical protein